MLVREPSLIDLEAEMPTGGNLSYEQDPERLNERAPAATGDAIVRSYGNTETKKCTKCGIDQKQSEYPYRKGKYRKEGARHTECRKCANATRQARYRNKPGHADKLCQASRKSYFRMRSETIAVYGGTCSCCGEDNELFLTFDHIHNDGASHRKKIGDGGKYLVSWIKKNNYPDTIQLLCHNCNCAKGFYGVCPHKSNRKKLAEMTGSVD